MPILIDVKARCEKCEKEIMVEDVPLNTTTSIVWTGIADKISTHSWKMLPAPSKRNWHIVCNKCKW